MKRLFGRGRRAEQPPASWDELENSMEPALSGFRLASYKGAVQTLSKLAEKFRNKFVGEKVVAPLYLKQLTGMLLGLWAQGFQPAFSFKGKDISNARKSFILATMLHSEFHFDCRFLVLSRKIKRMEF